MSVMTLTCHSSSILLKGPTVTPSLPPKNAPRAVTRTAPDECNLCASTGRYRPYLPAYRLEKHCECAFGRTMSRAHWDAKAAEEVAA